MKTVGLKDDHEYRQGEQRECIKEPVILSAMDAACIIQFLDERIKNSPKRWMLDVLMRGSKEFRQ